MTSVLLAETTSGRANAVCSKMVGGVKQWAAFTLITIATFVMIYLADRWAL